MRKSRIRDLVPVKAPTRPLDLATPEALGLTDSEYRRRLFAAAVTMVFDRHPDGSLEPREATDDTSAALLHEAIKLLRRLLKDNPDDAEAWAVLGAAYAGIRDVRDAEVAFRRAYALDPTSPTAAQGVYQAAIHSGEYELAREAAATSAAAFPDDVTVQLWLAFAEIMGGWLDDAERTIESISDRFPDEWRPRSLATIVARYRDGSLALPDRYDRLEEHLLAELVGLFADDDSVEDQHDAAAEDDRADSDPTPDTTTASA